MERGGGCPGRKCLRPGSFRGAVQAQFSENHRRESQTQSVAGLACAVRAPLRAGWLFPRPPRSRHCGAEGLGQGARSKVMGKGLRCRLPSPGSTPWRPEKSLPPFRVWSRLPSQQSQVKAPTPNSVGHRHPDWVLPSECWGGFLYLGGEGQLGEQI